MNPKNPVFFRCPILGGAFWLGILNLLLFGDLFWKGKDQVLSSSQADLYLHFVAWRAFAFDQLRQGHFVLWNPHYLCGAPFLGGFEAALLYPPNWLYMLLPLGPAINIGIIFHIFLAGFFTYLWALRRGLHPVAALTAGSIFMWGGAYYLHLFAGHLPNLCTMVWAPLIFLSIDGLVEKLSTRWILLGIFAVSLQILAGHPQYVYFTAIMACIFVALNFYEARSKKELLFGFFVIYAGAFMLTAVQLWTGIEAFKECGRNIPLDIRSAGSFSFPPENVLTLFLPDLFGNLVSVHYWGRWYLWEVSLFIGVVGFFLAAFAVKEGEFPKIRWIFGSAIIAFLFSLGTSTPLYGFFYDFFPFFKSIRGICKFDYLVSLFLAILAGTGLDLLIRSKKTPGWILIFNLLAGTVLTVMGFLVYYSASKGLSGDWGQWFTSLHWLSKTVDLMGTGQKRAYLMESGLQAARSLWIGGGTFILVSVLLGLRAWKRKFTYALGVLCVFELFLFARANRPTFELLPLEKKFDALHDFYSKNPGEYRVYGTASASLVTGGDDIWEDEPMIPGRYGRFVCFSQGLSENQLFSVAPIYQKFPSLLGILRLKYRIFMDEQPIRIAPFPFKTLPRMILMNQWEVIPDSQKILPALFDPKFDPAQKVYLEKEPELVPAPGKVHGELEWKDISTEEIMINANVSKDCVLLITDNYSQGWRAEDLPESGQSHHQVMPGNYFLTAIPLKAGKHHFLLEYRPTVFEVGKWVSIFSCILYFVVLLILVKRNYFSLKAAL